MLSRARHASPANGVMIALSNWGPGYQWLGPLSIARLIHGTASSVTTPIDQMSTTGPNIIVHKAAVSELPAIKACPTVLNLPERTMKKIGNPISQRTEMTAPIFSPLGHSTFLLTNHRDEYRHTNCSWS